jgi:23S rRNA (guanosine2251-2'-O)-methyltransferase
MDERIIVGYHAIEEALRSGNAAGGVLHVSRKNERVRMLLKLAGEGRVKIRRESDDALRALAQDSHGGEDPRGAVLVLETPARGGRKTLEKFLEVLEDRDALILVLDGITDPQNLGAILRSADQFGVDIVLLPSRRSAGINSTVMKVSSGAAAYVEAVEVPNIPRALELLKENGFWIYGADLGGTPLWECDFAGRIALVLGAEGRGVGRLVSEHCDTMVTIPMSGHVDSLNVSVATGIILYEVRRASRVRGSGA